MQHLFSEYTVEDARIEKFHKKEKRKAQRPKQKAIEADDKPVIAYIIRFNGFLLSAFRSH
ncbi:hypothetical protein ACTJJ0_16475 [Chitinophaga sp. 22321]|uniref:Uncharacterized protein n=1 Tax=Chitinophaga hostae TaxID=2831022 RepID=A0ABS5J274_9BACT|nr:hypothetical protein [Chitinophaga hostae]MBS0029328.1 hypothetical protein [Chitinophaga hostae]